MNYISKNIDYIKSEIINSCKKVNRENGINLIAVTKTVDIDAINEAIESGITDVGENKPQELARKYDFIGDKVRWHQIGSLQTNKVKYIIDKVYMIHSIDRLSLCEEIQKRAEKINKTINCLIQVNISEEESKQGISKDEAIDFIKTISEKYKNIKVKGLMTMAPYTEDESIIRDTFKGLKDLSEEISRENIENVYMDELSMGMSNDFKIAVEEGSTLVRVGTYIFGERDYNKN